MDMDNPEEKHTNVPKYGFKVRLDKQFPHTGGSFMVPKLSQIWTLIPLFLRYIVYYIKKWWIGMPAIMDYFDTQTSKKMYGVPLGGMGVGTIGRGFKGEFCRFQLIPGMYEYNTVFANQFIITIKTASGDTIFQSLLSAYKNMEHDETSWCHNSLKTWKSKINPEKCHYTGLYPRAWTEYDLSEHGIKLICRQISPVIPHNYKDTSLPCSVFVFDIKNTSNEPRKVSIAFTMKNGTGNKFDQKSTCNSKAFTCQKTEGVMLYNTIKGTPCKYNLGVTQKDDQEVSKCLYFNPNGDGSDIWKQLEENGKFSKQESVNNEDIYGEMGVAINAFTEIPANTRKNMEFTLVWDMPYVNFYDKRKKYRKYYTRHFTIETAFLKLTNYALENFNQWEKDIYAWQAKVLTNEQLPDWYKSALFNESYFVSDGGSMWFDLEDTEKNTLPNTDPRINYGRFGYLEGHEYRMVNTYDVHFYASFALAVNWPQLQKVLQYDMRDAVFTEITEKVTALYDGKVSERKVKNSVPHDVGDPAEQPFSLVNAYPIHDVSEWRDLNSKFVLQVYRDYCISKESSDEKYQYLNDMIEACHTVMQKSLTFDTDGDGLIENSGSADQTFDTWVMNGASAYCGGLWLAALYAMATMCNTLKDTLKSNYYKGILDQAKEAFNNKLWNGNYYNFDCSKNAKTIMADQLCGHWYLRCCGNSYEVFNKHRVFKSLQTVFENNVMKFNNGTLGAVNGYTSKGVDDITIQSEEVWTGVTYGVAAHMLFEGFVEEAWITAGGMFKTLTETMGMAYETPEAIFKKLDYRSIGYMRPLSIWSMQLAVDKQEEEKSHKK